MKYLYRYMGVIFLVTTCSSFGMRKDDQTILPPCGAPPTASLTDSLTPEQLKMYYQKQHCSSSTNQFNQDLHVSIDVERRYVRQFFALLAAVNRIDKTGNQQQKKSIAPLHTEDDRLPCVVCLEDLYQIGKGLVSFPCGEKHVIHRDCFSGMVNSDRTLSCPLCRNLSLTVDKRFYKRRSNTF